MAKKKTKLTAHLVFDALGNDVRRSILTMLMEQPHSVAQIAKAFPISRPAISRHLAQLVGAGLLQFKSQGTQNLYVLDTRGIEQSRIWLDSFGSSTEAPVKKVTQNSKKKKAHAAEAEVSTKVPVVETQPTPPTEELIAVEKPKKKAKPRKKEPEPSQTFDLFGGLD